MVSKRASCIRRGWEIKERLPETPCVRAVHGSTYSAKESQSERDRLIWNSVRYPRYSSHERAWRLLSSGNERRGTLKRRNADSMGPRGGGDGYTLLLFFFRRGTNNDSSETAIRFSHRGNEFTEPRVKRAVREIYRRTRASVREPLRGRAKTRERVGLSKLSSYEETRYDLTRFCNSREYSRGYLLTARVVGTVDGDFARRIGYENLVHSSYRKRANNTCALRAEYCLARNCLLIKRFSSSNACSLQICFIIYKRERNFRMDRRRRNLYFFLTFIIFKCYWFIHYLDKWKN